MILWRGFCNGKLPAHLNVDESGIADLANVEEAVKTLKPVKDASVFMSEESSPTVSLIAPVYAQLLQSMSDTIASQQISLRGKTVGQRRRFFVHPLPWILALRGYLS